MSSSVGRPLRFRMWSVPREEVPTSEDECVDWLNGWWQEIDRWVRGQRAEALV